MAIEDKVKIADAALKGYITHQNDPLKKTQTTRNFRGSVNKVLKDPNFIGWASSNKSHMEKLQTWANAGTPPHTGHSARSLQGAITAVQAAQVAAQKAAAALQEQKVQKTMGKLFK